MRNRMLGAGRLAFVGCAAVMGTMLIQSPAMATDVTPSSTAEAKVLVERLTAQQRAAEDQFNQVNGNYISTAAVLDQRTADILKQQDKVEKLRANIGSLALSRYHNRGQETTQAIVTGKTDDVIRRLATIDHVDATLNVSLQNLQEENGRLSELTRQQEIDAAKAKAERDKLGDLDKAAKDNLSRAEALLGQLTEADRRAYEEEQARKQAAAQESRRYTARTETKQAAEVVTAENKPVEAKAPDAKAPEATRTAAAKPAEAAAASSASTATGLRSSSNARGNFYDPGSCVWWAYNRRAQMGAPVSSLWGSALTWPGGAAAEGFRVDHTPQVGAVMITMPGALGATGHGHAAVVESVAPDGSFTVSQMNAPAQGVLTSQSFSAGQAAYASFIH